MENHVRRMVVLLLVVTTASMPLAASDENSSDGPKSLHHLLLSLEQISRNTTEGTHPAAHLQRAMRLTRAILAQSQSEAPTWESTPTSPGAEDGAFGRDFSCTVPVWRWQTGQLATDVTARRHGPRACTVTVRHGDMNPTVAFEWDGTIPSGATVRWQVDALPPRTASRSDSTSEHYAIQHSAVQAVLEARLLIVWYELSDQTEMIAAFDLTHLP